MEPTPLELIAEVLRNNGEPYSSKSEVNVLTLIFLHELEFSSFIINGEVTIIAGDLF